MDGTLLIDTSMDNDDLSSSPLSSCPSSIYVAADVSDNPLVNQFIQELISGFNLIQPTLESWLELYNESDLMLPHLIAAETDVALYSIIHEQHPDWTSLDIVELLERTHTLICTALPFPDTCTSVILPQLRNAFPIQTYSQALLDWIKSTTSTTPTIKHGILVDPLLVSFVVGRGTKPNDLILIGELSVNLILSELNCLSSEMGLNHFRTVMKCACGYVPVNCVMYLVGVFECLQTSTLEMADLFITLFPTIDTYELNHGDLGLFLAELQRFEYSPVPNFKQFGARLLAHYPIRTDLSVFLNIGLKPTTVEDLNTLYTNLNPSNLVNAKLMYNALVNGSAPLHVRLAFQIFNQNAPTLAPIALALFKFAYENPLAIAAKYKLSGRLNDWRMLDRPSTAMDKIYNLINKQQPKTQSPASVHQYFNCLTELEFGFMDPNELDEIELMTKVNNNLGHEELYTLDTDIVDTDCIPPVDSIQTEVSDDPVLDKDFIQLCFDQIDQANGDLDAVNIECLVDDLISRRHSSRFTSSPAHS